MTLLLLLAEPRSRQRCEPRRNAGAAQSSIAAGWRRLARGRATALNAVVGPSTTKGKQREVWMSDHIYKVVELVGSSPISIEDAIQGAVGRASKTLRNLRWFEVLETRGHIEDGKVHHYQVTLKIGFTLAGD